MEPTTPPPPTPSPTPSPQASSAMQEKKDALRRTWLIVAAAILVTVLACGQCAWDIGVTTQIGKFSNCIYAPHVCNGN